MRQLKIARKTALYLVLTVMAIVMLYPFLWSLTASFKTNAQLYSGNPLDLLPKPLTFENYIRAWTLLPYYRFLLNSAMLSVIVPTCSVLLASLAAYSFARLRFRGRDAVFLILLGVMMMPGHITLIPNYSLMRTLGWINDYKALIIPAIFSGTLVINIFFMRQYILAIPKELDEAAIIDGCSRFGIWRRVIMPNSMPAIATISILAFVSEWNAFLWPVVVMNDFMKMPIQVGLSYFKSSAATDWGVLMAATVMSILPLILVFLFFQKHFIKSMLTSGLNGR